ncbi:MBL fold metallo-hydrolase [Candidatus Woesearchaeota archaeon]|nr:MBL fold metallo-hydrolase [Candidatus Woesearchaeota archaeon]
MKITKYVQSCFLIETKGKRILVDPGKIKYEDSLLEKDWADIDVLLVTHKHSDHCHDDAVKEIIKNPKTKFYTTKETAEAHPELSPEIVKEGDVLEFDDIKVEVVKAVHGVGPWMKGKGAIIYENVGYIVDDGETRAYHTSDSIAFEHNYKCDVLLVPVSNHCVTMSPWEAAEFAKDVEAKITIPMHADSPLHPVDFDEVKRRFEQEKINYKILEAGEVLKYKVMV